MESTEAQTNNSETVESVVATETENADASKKAKPDKRIKLPFVKSIVLRTGINYMLYSITLLVLLWASFFIYLFSVYSGLQRRAMVEIGGNAAEIFPDHLDDNSMNYYIERMCDIAVGREVSVSVLAFNADGTAEFMFTVDTLGNPTHETNDTLISVAEYIQSAGDYIDSDSTITLPTVRGMYMCNVQTREVDGGKAYILVMKKYAILTPQTKRFIYILVFCTITILLLAILFSFISSRSQTKKLVDFSQKAKLLAAGDYNVRFSGDGYKEYDNLANALNAAKDEIEKAENMQRDLIANVSHDIRTPLTMIRAYAEMIRDMPVDEKKRKKTADVIISESERLNTLVDDVLSYSRMQAGAIEYSMETCDISEIAKAVLVRFDIFRERDGVVFDVEIAGDIKAVCDRQRIEQVLYNLLNNAINYRGEDNTVMLRVGSADGAVHVEVGDHGKGIAPEDVDSVWDRYYRTAHAKRTTVGSGLGLSICKSILEAHDARFGINSELGKGSTFWFELDSEQKK